MNYTSSPNQRTNSHEASPYQSRLFNIKTAVTFVALAVHNQGEQTEVRTMRESFTSQHPAAPLAYGKTPENITPASIVHNESTVRASLDVAYGDGRQPAEIVQAQQAFNLTEQFQRGNQQSNIVNYGYRPGDSTHGSV